MKKILPLAFLVVSCTMAQLPPPEQRRITLNEKVKGTKNQLYVATLTSLTKNLGNSNSAIKMQDKDAGVIVAKMNISCNIFRQTGDINEYSLSFNFSSKASDNLLKMDFEDLKIVGDTGKEVTWEYNQITNKEKVEKAKACLEPVKSKIIAEI